MRTGDVAHFADHERYDEIGDGGGSDEGVHAGIRPLVSEEEWRGGNLIDDRFVLQDCCLVG